jgi:hypothetical protein
MVVECRKGSFLKILKDKGVDLIDVSSGALVSKKILVGPNYQVQDQIKSQAL